MSVKKFRFAALIRVSTEKQEKHGESLRTQRLQITNAVKDLGGKIVGWYGGQEHATSGTWERKELDRLERDAAKNPRLFDAVIVFDASRWSRDNARSKQGLEIFRQAGIRFFTLTQEHNLFDPNAILFLGLAAEIGEYQARQQKLKSVLSCIERAKRLNAPTAGRIPFGRIWNKKTSTWSVDEAKKRIVEEVASRYLSGESLKDLAEEHKINHSFLHKTLTKNCGCSHTIRWNIPDLNIDTSVVLTIPRLLPEKTIKAIQTKAKANRTYQHGCPKNPYLLTGYIFCTCCGYALSGQANRNGLLYYRHYPPSKGVKVDCPADPSPYPRAEEIESSVIKELFLTFGNPAAVERALNKMMPDQEKAQKQRDQIAKLKNELEQIRLGRAKVMDMAVLGIPDHEIKSKIEELNGQEALIARKISELSSHLDGLPSKEQILDVAQEIGKRFRKKVSAKRWMMMMDAEDFDHMEWADKRALIEAVFASDQPDGRPMGIYLSALPGQKRHRSKRWIFELFGMIPNFRGMPEYSDGANPLEGFVCVTRSASHSPKPFLPERHFR